MKRTILITGGAGFIGSNFTHHVLRERPDWRVIVYDALTYAGNLESLRPARRHPGYRFVRGDILDRRLLERTLRHVDTVVHLAAESHVDRSIDDAAPFLTTNVMGTHAVLEACRTAGVHRLVHVSTDEVYGSLPLNRSEARFTERSPLRPTSPYAASKASSDLLALAYARTHGTPVCVTRCSNNFGPRQFPEKVIPLFATNLINGRPVPLYGDGRNVRDWIHVEDHCTALLAVAEHGRDGSVYNIGADNEQSNLQLTRCLLEMFGADWNMVEHVRDRPAHDLRYAVDSSLIRDELGWRPRRSAWPEALNETVEWYRENASWWRPLKEGAFNAPMLRPALRETPHNGRPVN